RRGGAPAGVRARVGSGAGGVVGGALRQRAADASLRESPLHRGLQPGWRRGVRGSLDPVLRSELRDRSRGSGAGTGTGRCAGCRARGDRRGGGRAQGEPAAAARRPPARDVRAIAARRSWLVSEHAPFDTVDAVQRSFAVENYIADRPLGLTVMLATQLGKPILLEGEAGVGKKDLPQGPGPLPPAGRLP